MLYEIIDNGLSVYGPGPWNIEEIKTALFIRGYTMRGGAELFNAADIHQGTFPTEEPLATMYVGAIKISSPDLPALKESAIIQTKQAINDFVAYFWPPLKVEAVKQGVPPYDGPGLEQLQNFVAEMCLTQFTAADAISQCADEDALFSLMQELRETYSPYLP